MNEKNTDREFKIFSIIALVVIVICLSIAYIALSRQLKIQAPTKVKKANWNIEISQDEDSFPVTKVGGEGRLTYETESMDGTMIIKNLNVRLRKPGDFGELTIPIKNNGDIDAYLAYVGGLKDSISCTSTGENKLTDEKIVCGDSVNPASVKYTIMYDNFILTKGIEGISDLSLREGVTKNVKIRVEYLESATKIPNNTVTVLLPEIQFFYQQID